MTRIISAVVIGITAACLVPATSWMFYVAFVAALAADEILSNSKGN